MEKVENVLTSKTKESQQLTEKIKNLKQEIDTLERQKNLQSKELRNREAIFTFSYSIQSTY
jgi:septal ring factor EnvC (AmiA/AmiB activator)